MQNKIISFNPPMANALILYPPPWKHQKSNDFLVLSVGIKWEHNSEMGWTWLRLWGELAKRRNYKGPKNHPIC